VPAFLAPALVGAITIAPGDNHVAKLLGAKLVASNMVSVVVSAPTTVKRAHSH
jgi:hypothetical protein